MNKNGNNQGQHSDLSEVDSLSESSDSSSYSSDSDSESDNGIINPNDELTVITNENNQKVLVKKRKISSKSKNKGDVDDNDDSIEEFKGSVIPYSANLRVIIKQLEDDVPILDELHKKFADQLYRLRTEEANLEKQLEKELEKEDQDS